MAVEQSHQSASQPTLDVVLTAPGVLGALWAQGQCASSLLLRAPFRHQGPHFIIFQGSDLLLGPLLLTLLPGVTSALLVQKLLPSLSL